MCFLRFVLVIISVAFIYGCGAVVNPYKGEFTCPQAEPGKCVGIPQAYVEVLNATHNQTDIVTNFMNMLYQQEGRSSKEFLLTPAEERYIESLYDKLSGLLKDPSTPVISPPKVVRVLILPYSTSEGKVFNSARYAFVIIDDPKWVLQNIIDMLGPEE